MRQKILIVDDAAEVLAMMSDLLGGAGYTVLAASTLEDGVRLAEGAQPDLIMIDIRLGANNGIQLAIRERLRHPGRPLIVMSGFADPVLVEEVRRIGAHYLDKSAPPDTLMALVTELLPPADAEAAQ
jgi:DNA-binding response OmpR family regulator